MEIRTNNIPRFTVDGIEYRGKRLKYWMENENINVLFERAKKWAFSNGFTHIKVYE